MSRILDGKILNEKIAANLSKEIAKLSPKPSLVIIQIGNNQQSNAYISRKIKFGEKIGATVDLQKYPEDITQEKLLAMISKLNTDSNINGIIVQMPFPNNLDKDIIIESINPTKDVDGLTSKNIKKLWENKRDAIIPATTKGILTLLIHYQIPISRQQVVIIGRSSLVGKPTLLALLNSDATVTVCHKATRNLPQHTKVADILVVAAGKANLIGQKHVSTNQVVIDVGMNVLSENPTLGTNEEKPRKLTGDVNFSEVSPIVRAITPVPGGVGPMTVASLFQNLLQSYKNQIN